MSKSLKEQNNWKLWLVLAANAVFFYTVIRTGSLQLSGVQKAFGEAGTLAPVGIAGILATVLNALPSADLKATFVFWRLKFALPGHRSFSRYARSDTRINTDRLIKMFKGKLPTAPAEQNAAWYKLYKTVQNDIVVADAHKTFLLLRDYTSLSVVLLAVFGLSALILLPDKRVGLAYVGMLVTQYLIVRQGAANAGVRMVTNVLALKTAAARF